jgi:hypothetical protein
LCPASERAIRGRDPTSRFTGSIDKAVNLLQQLPRGSVALTAFADYPARTVPMNPMGGITPFLLLAMMSRPFRSEFSARTFGL